MFKFLGGRLMDDWLDEMQQSDCIAQILEYDARAIVVFFDELSQSTGKQLTLMPLEIANIYFFNQLTISSSVVHLDDHEIINDAGNRFLS